MVEPEIDAPSVFTMPQIVGFVGFGLFVGLASGRSMLALLCVLLLSTVGVARGWSHLSSRRLRDELSTDTTRLFPGEAFVVDARVRNAKVLPVWIRVRIPVDSALQQGESEPLGAASGLMSFQEARFTWRMTASRRGVHRLGPTRIETADPLGFFPVQRTGGFTDVVVYPRLVPLEKVAVPLMDLFGKRGRHLIEDPAYVDGIRDHIPGRPARYIHWPATARRRQVVEKRCEPTYSGGIVVVVLVDGFADDDSGVDFERCLEVVASLIVELTRARWQVALETNGRIKEATNENNATPRSETPLVNMLDTLARVEPVPAGDFETALGTASVATAGVSVIAFSHSIDAGLSALDARLKRRRVPLIRIVQRLDGPVGEPHHGRVILLPDIRSEGEPETGLGTTTPLTDRESPEAS